LNAISKRSSLRAGSSSVRGGASIAGAAAMEFCGVGVEKLRPGSDRPGSEAMVGQEKSSGGEVAEEEVDEALSGFTSKTADM